MRFAPAAVAALALAVAGCQLGPRPVATLPPPGDWAVVSMHAGERAVRDPQAALARQGQVLRFEADRAVSGAHSCMSPRYLVNDMVADRYLRAELALRHHDLGLYRHQDVRITEVYCGGRKWRALGGTVLWVSDTQGFAVADGVVHELRPVPARQ